MATRPEWELRADRRLLVRAAVADARAGRPRVLCLDGASGMGKTAHLQRIVAEAAGFGVLRASGDPATYRPPLGVLQQLGVERVTVDDGTPHAPAVAAQALRRLIDDRSRDGALLLVVDDAQWADPETMDALRLVLERVSGDPLLVVVASRPLKPTEHLPWQRFRDRPEAVTAITLDGIDLAEAVEIARAHGAAAADPSSAETAVVERLWRYTDGNPMYLRSLLAQYSLADLGTARELPAPAELARDLDARLASMDEDAATLLRAVAVIGSSWVDRLDAAAVAGIDDATAAVELLLDDGLIVARPGGALSDVRIVHGLVRAAIYQSIPVAERRMRHRRAAEALAPPMLRLEHEVAAAGRRDAALAARLETVAADVGASGDQRRAAQLLLWAAQLSETVPDRECRWLDAQLATVLARDVASVRAQLEEIAWASDVPRRTVVLTMLLVAENRIAEARRLVQSVTDADLEHADPLTGTRLRVLTAWLMLTSGYPTDEIRAVLDAVPADAVRDTATASYLVRTAGQIAGRENDFEHIGQDFAAVPLNVRDTPVQDTTRLGWRGAIHAICGFAPEGRRDLSEVVARIRDGRVDPTGGVDQALYGFALWQDGEIDRAAIELKSAVGLALDRPQPLVQAALPLVPAVRGNLSRADALLAESESVLRDLPWTEAIIVLTIAQVVRLHAGDDARARASYLDRLRSTFGAEVASAQHPSGAIWHLHVAIAKIWASEVDDVEQHLVAIETDMIVPGWARWARPWLLGLASERRGDAVAALREMRDAAGLLDDALPLYRAHLHVDLARLSEAAGDAVWARRALSAARTLYARIGAAPYLQRLGAGDEPAEPSLAVFRDLSDREREVAALVVAGFSYAQITEELFVTRSTVGFHLGNIYAKTGVSSRHALTRLARG